ncbi:cell division protein PerM, partial [Angustibacter aerolatus]
TSEALRAAGVTLVPALSELVRLPSTWRRAARPGALAAALVLLVAALLVLVAVVVGHDRVLTLHRALDAGVVGGGLLALAQAALLPDLVGWAVGFVAGPGFALGAGTSVTTGGSSLGLLPLVPVLGAVPPSGALPSVLVVLPLLPVLAGAVAGWLVARRPDDVPGEDGGRTTTTVLLEALAAAVVAVVLLTALVLLSGGGAGPGALRTVGASAWRVALVLAGEVGAGAVVAAWITRRRQHA